MRAFKNCSFLFLALFCLALPLRAETLVALLTDKTLRYFDSTTPNAWLKTVTITGIPDAESVQALDFRPDGRLVVLAREGLTVRAYEVDPSTGVATGPKIGLGFASANAVGFDAFGRGVHSFDLVAVTESDEMKSFFFEEAGSGSALKAIFYDNDAADGDPADVHSGANPNIVALGSTNGFRAATSAVLYGIDATQNSLVKINWSTGSIDTVAEVRTAAGATVAIDGRTGLDISGVTGNAYLSVASSSGSATQLFKLDLTSGVVTGNATIGPALQMAGVLVQDITALPPTDVANVSTRGKVGAGEDQMIVGFITNGGASTRLVIRGLGPSLAPFGVNNFLANPVLKVFDGNGGEIATNDDWKSDQQTELSQTGLAPGYDLEAAYVADFPPGSYTAIVSGNAGGTGVGVVEVYNLSN